MEQEMVTAYCGEGRGKTAAALGQGLIAAGKGKSVIVIQFLKGRQGVELEILKRMEPEIKLFRFDRFAKNYNELAPGEKEEEAANIRNAFGFARKVLVTGECDLLILDEILGLVDLGLVTTEDVRGLLNARDDSMGLVITGINMGEELMPYVDRVYEITSLKKV